MPRVREETAEATDLAVSARSSCDITRGGGGVRFSTCCGIHRLHKIKSVPDGKGSAACVRVVKSEAAGLDERAEMYAGAWGR